MMFQMGPTGKHPEAHNMDKKSGGTYKNYDVVDWGSSLVIVSWCSPVWKKCPSSTWDELDLQSDLNLNPPILTNPRAKISLTSPKRHGQRFRNTTFFFIETLPESAPPFFFWSTLKGIKILFRCGASNRTCVQQGEDVDFRWGEEVVLVREIRNPKWPKHSGKRIQNKWPGWVF